MSFSPFAQRVFDIVGTNSEQRFGKEMAQLRRSLADLDGGSFRQMEAAIRELGELLGYSSTRPDNDLRTGPDVLWVSTPEKCCLPIELKTDKVAPATYFKSDVKDGHDHLSFVANNAAATPPIGVLFVGPPGDVAADANPSPEMWLSEPSAFIEVRERVFGILNDVRRLPPLERREGVIERCHREEWALRNMLRTLGAAKLLKA